MIYATYIYIYIYIYVYMWHDLILTVSEGFLNELNKIRCLIMDWYPSKIVNFDFSYSNFNFEDEIITLLTFKL